MKKFVIFISSLLLSATFLWSGKWHVCVGSYIEEKNAVNFQKELKAAGYQSFIHETVSGEKKMYRVLLGEEFENAEEARKFSREFEGNTFSLRHKLKGLWIVSKASENPPATEPEQITETPVVLEKNSEIPVSEEKPFSVHIQTYREEQTAENDRQRLAEKDIDAYVLKKLDKKEAIKFDLQAGAFKTAEEAKVLEEQLEAMDLPNLEITDYNDYADELSEFDDVITRREVTFDNGINEIPDSVPETVKVCLNQFPVNENFQIKAVKIFDLVNLKEKNRTEGFEFAEKNIPENFAKDTSALSYVEYVDNLFKKEVIVLVAINENSSYENFFIEGQENFVITETDFDLPYGKLHSFITQVGKDFMIQGITEDKKMYVQMLMPGFTKEEMIAFVENSYSDSSLLFYPQIRKSLCIIPDKGDGDNSFLWFNFSQVDESYAENKDYADWALKIVGHWESKFFICHKDETVSVSLFDLDYDYNAKEVHKIFMDEKNEMPETYGNHYVSVNEQDGWYLENFRNNELSFSQKSYIIAADSESGSTIQENELKSLVDQLKIWK
ncbi:SPOR domain-containing protein [Treponema sp.]|uniref:SPOR domain-containing protein n=1 Tax=Treponema sp. TaxID=166 RepID=UPI00298E6EDA|nr:SPOR domain-containing protein [Treponema sp.]MCQ2241985.1 SPOR domain-containing protein [Treponema sp.]